MASKTKAKESCCNVIFDLIVKALLESTNPIDLPGNSVTTPSNPQKPILKFSADDVFIASVNPLP